MTINEMQDRIYKAKEEMKKCGLLHRNDLNREIAILRRKIKAEMRGKEMVE